MEIWNSISNWSPGIAFGMACLYFFNFIVSKFLEEKSEWNQAMSKMVDRYDARLVENTTALVNAASQDHQLRTKLQEWMTLWENRWTILDNRSRGGGND